ncbi:hypothetical protein BJV77DRAFT_1066136 [Russula vinacea]|nr:hypothetical protein BJV77DRAFT_1066136 [Russula vinacea]
MLSSVDSHRQAHRGQGNPGFIVGGDGSGTNAGASPGSVGQGGERIDQQWSGTLAWRGTIRTDISIERKEARTQVTATASKGDPLASTWPKVLLLAPAGPAVSIGELHDWFRKNNPVVMRIRPTSGMDVHCYGQLVKLLRFKSCYAIGGWEIPGKGLSTLNFLIAPFMHGLLGAAFPTTGMPDIPKP